VLLRELRHAGFEAHMEYEGRSIRSQMKRADRLGARVAVILGDDELVRGDVTVKNMATGDQVRVGRAQLVAHLRSQNRG
jgi:histidyl-tRNA synthetase